jgi:lipopolysaccharide transport system permease protein
MAVEANPKDEVLIKPVSGWVSIDLGELWRYRELMYFFVWRDLKVRYKQTILGVLWAILQPIMTMVVMSIIFGRVAKIPTNDIPYPIFAYSALLPWLYFSGGMSRAAGSMVGSAGLITKVYFPRLIVPVSGVIGGLPDLLLSFIVLIGLMIYYSMYPTIHVIWLLPLLIVLATITALGVGLWLAAVNVRYRDVRYIVPFLTQFWMYLTPVIYPADLLSKKWQILYGLNPMVGVVEGFRWALLNQGSPPGPLVALSAVMSLLLFITGAMFFRRMERTFADVV